MLPAHRRLWLYIASGIAFLRRSFITWGLVLLGLAVGQGANALSLVVIARKVPVVDFGQYLACLGLANLLIVLPNFGLELWLLTRGASTESETAHLWRSALRVRVVLAVSWLCVTGMLSIWLPRQTYPILILLPTLASVLLDGITLLIYAAFRTVNLHQRVTVLQILVSGATLGLAASLPPETATVTAFAVGRATLSALFLAIAYGAGQPWLKGGQNVLPLRRVVASAAPFALSDVATAAYDGAGLTIVSMLLGAAAAGLYGPALSILQFVYLVPRSMFLFVTPYLSRNYAKAGESFVRISVAQLAGQVLSGLALSSIVILFAPKIVALSFGPAYAGSADLLRLLGLIPLLKSTNFALAAVLASANLQTKRTRIQVVCAALTVGANRLLVASLGVTGPIVVHYLGELVLCAGYSWAAYCGLRGRLVVGTGSSLTEPLDN